MVNVEKVEQLLKQTFPQGVVEVDCFDGKHVECHIKSKQFKGKTLIEQHQMVYAPLKEMLKEELHALAIKTEVQE